MFLLLATLACSDKDSDTPADSAAETDADTDADTDTDTDSDADGDSDADADADADADTDSDTDADTSKLRVGYWDLTIVAATTNTCGFSTEPGEVIGMVVELSDQGDTVVDGSVVIVYEGSDLRGNSEASISEEGVDCATTITTSASGVMTDWMTLERWGRHDVLSSEGTECDEAPGGADGCEVDMTFTGAWSSDETPEPE